MDGCGKYSFELGFFVQIITKARRKGSDNREACEYAHLPRALHCCLHAQCMEEDKDLRLTKNLPIMVPLDSCEFTLKNYVTHTNFPCAGGIIFTNCQRTCNCETQEVLFVFVKKI